MKNKKLILIAGNCAIEDETTTRKTAEKLKEITDKYDNIEFIFKASYDKANRTSNNSLRGVGLETGLGILSRIKAQGIKILTDTHTVEEAKKVALIADIVQIPAFLCRQTDLIHTIGRYARKVNIKKGQFLSPWDIKYVIEKVEATGNKNIMITERGTCFGYNNLIVDFRSFMIMKKFGNYPIIFDATHSQQIPSKGGKSGGNREFVIPMIKGAIATGYVDGIFIEVHPEPDKAISDSATQLPLDDMENIIKIISEAWSKI